MSGVFRNTARRVCTLCTPPLLVRGEDTLAGGRGGGGSIVRKTPDTALYSIYVSTLWCTLSQCELLFASFRPHTSIYLFTQQNIKIMEFVVYIKREYILSTSQKLRKEVCLSYMMKNITVEYCIDQRTVTKQKS